MTKAERRFVIGGVGWGFSFLTIKMAQESTVSCAGYGFCCVSFYFSKGRRFRSFSSGFLKLFSSSGEFLTV